MIWNDEENGGWNIGFQVNSTAIIHSPDKVANPIQATSWKYVSNGKWIDPMDILVGPGMSSKITQLPPFFSWHS